MEKRKPKGQGGTNKRATNMAAIRARALERRAKVAELMVKGFTLAQTVKELGCSERTVKNDRQAIREGFRESANWSYGEYAEIERLRLEHIGQQALEEWDKSGEPSETITIEKDDQGSLVKTTIKEEAQVRDGRFLEIAIKASESRRKLLGLDKPTTDEHVHVHAHAHQHEVTVVEDERWYGNDAHNLAAETVAAPVAGVIESKAIQGSGVRPSVGQNGNGSANGHKGPRSET